MDGEPISLTPIEYDILKLLMESPGKVYSPKEIYRQVWKELRWGATTPLLYISAISAKKLRSILLIPDT